MKEDFTNFIDGFFTFLLVICSLQCLSSSFGLIVNFPIVVVCTALFTTIFALLAVLEKSNLKYAVSLCVIFIVFVLMIIFSGKTFLAELSYVLNCVLGLFSRFLPVAENIELSSLSANSATTLFVAMSLPISGFLTMFIMRSKRILPVAIITIMVITPCFILVNTPPNILPLITIFIILFTLFLSSSIHRTNPLHSGAVSSVVFILMAILATAVYLFNPVEGYKRSEWQDNLLNLTKQVTKLASNYSKSGSASSSKINIEQAIDLSNAGPLEKKGRKIMTISSEYEGKLYLKGIAYSNYENNTWSILTKQQAEEYPVDFHSATMTKSDTADTASINIITEDENSVIYTPYFLSSIPTSGTSIYDVLIKNNTNTKSYYTKFQPIKNNSVLWLEKSSDLISNLSSFSYTHNANNEDYKDFVYRNYLSVPGATKAEMIQNAKKNGFADLPKEYLIDAVKEYVKNSASYSLNTDKVPKDRDIALWLLNESNTGYCVHFATSSAVMLRSLGIPARYVTGYCVRTTSTKPTVVTSDNAHAWVEYFDDNIGWIPFDATPIDFNTAFEINQATLPEIEAEIATQQIDDSQYITDSQTAISEQQTDDTKTLIDDQQTSDTQATVEEETSTSKTATSPNNKEAVWKPILKPFFVVIFTIIFIILLTVLALLLRRIIILSARKRFFSTGKRNNRVKHLYRYILKTSKYSHLPIPEQIEKIAEKARFSNIRTNQDELNIILSFTEKRIKTLISEASSLKKLYFKYIAVLF